jgi:DNA mismatch repair protein MutS2
MEPSLPRKTAVDLDWQRLRQALAQRCATPMGEAEAIELGLLPDADAVARRVAEVTEAWGLLDRNEPPPLEGFVQVAGHLDRASRHAVLEAAELIDVGRTVAASRRLASFLGTRRDAVPRLAGHVTPGSVAEADQLADLEGLVTSCFEDDGTISDRASPELASLRNQARGLRERLSRTIEELIERYADVLQDHYFTVREDRYVLPVRTDAHRRVHGIVHGHSNSGQTIYVEPREITTLGNDLMIVRSEVAREEQRVLAELSEEVRLRASLVSEAAAGATRVDLRIAAARLGRDLGGAVPEIAHDGVLRLLQVRHPLLVLDGVPVVSNDIVLEPGKVLVVSGPNGGGKTVALKTVGIALLMFRAGLPVAASPDSRLPVARSVLTDMGDDQSLEQSLSTFAAHMTNIARLLGQTGAGDVALLDELAGGTDPTEGAALATEIARALASRGAAVMCTTHYGPLKLLAMQLEELTGASLGFDKNRLEPTFRLSSGAPGISGALAAALRYGLPEEVVEAARARMGEETQRLGVITEQLEAERDRARAQADAVVEERTALEHERKALERQREELSRRARDQIDGAARALLDELRAAREQVRQVEERLRLRRRVAEDEAKAATKTLDRVARDLAPGGKLAPALDQAQPKGRSVADESELVPGVKVYVRTMRAGGEVAEPPHRHKVRVSLGKIAVTVAVSDLVITDDQARKAATPARPPAIQLDAAADPEAPTMTPENTLDLRGERVDDAIREVDKFIDRALQKGWKAAFFIHGHGTGALKKALREHLEESPCVERSKPGEQRQGGDGVTVIWLA